MKIKPSQAAEEFIEAVHHRVGARNKAVLARAALCLALAEGVPISFKPSDSGGKEIDEETILGEELKDLIRAALNDKAGKWLDDAAYRQSFRNHLEYGCQRLKDTWEQSGNDPTRFISALLTLCASGFRSASPRPAEAMPVVRMATAQTGAPKTPRGFGSRFFVPNYE